MTKFMNRRLFSCLAAPLIILTVASSVAAHPTSGMAAVRGALKTWALAVLNKDLDELSDILHQDFLFNDATDKQSYLEAYGPNLSFLRITEINQSLAYFDHVGDDFEVSPVVTTSGLFKSGFKLVFRSTARGWKVHRMYPDQKVPSQLLDVDLPEKYPLHTVKFQLRDQGTRKLVAARVHVRDAQGTYWPPNGHQKNIPVGWRDDVGGDVLIDKKTYAYVWPEFEVPLAAGTYSIDMMRGIEYLPATLDFEVPSSGTSPVAITLERWSNIREQGWISGDTHVHFVDPRAAFLEGKAEDLSVVNILATKWGELITDVQRFRGGPEPSSDQETVVYVNEECRHGFLGHTVLMDLQDLVYPLTWGTGNEGVYGGIDYPAMAIQADKTHAQGGFVGWAHFPYPNGEIAIDIALGKVDSVDLFTWGDAFGPRGQRPGSAEVYYRFLNCGFDLPATAGTDKMFNTQVVGIPRTYVKIKGDLTYQKWIEGIRGRTFVTTGPVLFFEADGHQLGETVKVSAEQKVTLTARVHSRIPVEKIEIVHNGKIVALQENPDKSQRLEMQTQVTISGSSWVAARVHSSQQIPYQMSGIPVMAHTSPIYFQVDGRPRQSAQDAAFFIEWVDEALKWLEERANIPIPAQREEMQEIFQRARRVFERQPEPGA